MSTIHNHPILERKKEIDKYHVIVDRTDFEDAIEVQKRIDDLELKMEVIRGKIIEIGKTLKELEL